MTITHFLKAREPVVAFVLALTVAAAGIVNPTFLSTGNISAMLVTIVPALIVGCGLTFVILTGEIDISVGSLMGLLAALLGQLTSPVYANLPVSVAAPLILLAGTLVGLVNGLLVSFARVPSIIVTLGMLTALRGTTEILMAGKWITDLPAALRFLGTGSVLGVRVSVWTA